MAPLSKSDGKFVKGKISKNIIEHDVHVRLDIREGNVTSSKTALEEYRVLGIYIKEYNKWLVFEREWQPWNQDI